MLSIGTECEEVEYSGAAWAVVGRRVEIESPLRIVLTPHHDLLPLRDLGRSELPQVRRVCSEAMRLAAGPRRFVRSREGEAGHGCDSADGAEQSAHSHHGLHDGRPPES